MASATRTGIHGMGATESRLVITDGADGNVTIQYENSKDGGSTWYVVQNLRISKADVANFKTDISNLT